MSILVDHNGSIAAVRWDDPDRAFGEGPICLRSQAPHQCRAIAEQGVHAVVIGHQFDRPLPTVFTTEVEGFAVASVQLAPPRHHGAVRAECRHRFRCAYNLKNGEVVLGAIEIDITQCTTLIGGTPESDAAIVSMECERINVVVAVGSNA